MNQLFFYMFDVILQFYIYLSSWSNINTLYAMVDCERFSMFRVSIESKSWPPVLQYVRYAGSAFTILRAARRP